MKTALTAADQANARARVQAAVSELRLVVDLVGDVPGIAAHSYRALGTATALLDRIDDAPVVLEGRP